MGGADADARIVVQAEGVEAEGVEAEEEEEEEEGVETEGEEDIWKEMGQKNGVSVKARRRPTFNFFESVDDAFSASSVSSASSASSVV